jgi:hypothetical protein
VDLRQTRTVELDDDDEKVKRSAQASNRRLE